MSADPRPIFLERRTYRRRRLADAARMLPILGAVLFCLPLLWGGDSEAPGVETSYVMTYVFVVWWVLILLGGLISAWLHRDADESTAQSNE